MAGTTGWRGWRRIAWCGMLVAGSTWANPAYDFAYRLSGDRRVAPIQVFDDGSQTWLQFAPGQVLPAVFAGSDDATLTLARHTQQGPYLVLDGTAARIEMRIGEIMARADYAGSKARVAGQGSGPAPGGAVIGGLIPGGGDARPPSFASREAETLAAMPRRTTVVVPAPVVASTATPPQGPVVTVSAPATVPTVMPDPSPAASGSATGVIPLAAGRTGDDARAMLEFDAAIADGNMRRVLERWARQAGWLFQAEHWAVDVDIPLVGAAAFGADFRNAVRGLLGSTELGERPLQPCFYANRVLRVIPLAQACDRTLAPAVAVRGLP